MLSTSLSVIASGVANPNGKPPLNTAADYRACLQQTGSDAAIIPSYCMVYVELQPDNRSSVWQEISHYQNSHRFMYRHDKLYRGICTRNFRKLSGNHKPCNDTSDPKKVERSGTMQMLEFLHTISRQQKTLRRYEQLLHEHVNVEMQEIYNLSAKTLVTYCENLQEPLEKGKRI